MGATLSPRGREQVVPLIGAAAMAPFAAKFDANAAPVSASRVFATIPATLEIIEGVAWDARRHALYATSVHDHALARIAPVPATLAAGGDLGGLFGAVYDVRRGRIWAASAPTDVSRLPGAFAGLIAIDPARRGVTHILAPPGGEPGDVALASDGTLYASDGHNGALYRCRPGCTALETWIPPGRLFSAQGMAISADGKWLYVADYRYGLAAIERRTGHIFRVASDVPAMLDGIDGLVRDGRDLIAVQNGGAPQRIVRLSLSRGGLRVVRLTVLERANPAWGEPTLATIAGDHLLYVGDGQWARFEDPATPLPTRPTEIRMIDLKAAR
jgi:sugar lactone lactonase YvrE